jgi:transcriptional regulator with XRE-family HTH domain
MPAPAPTRRRGPRAVRPPARPLLAATLTLQGRTYANVARLVDITPESMARIVAGTIKPSAELRERIAAVLGADDLDALFALDMRLQALVDAAVAAGVDLTADRAADRIAGILLQSRGDRVAAGS